QPLTDGHRCAFCSGSVTPSRQCWSACIGVLRSVPQRVVGRPTGPREPVAPATARTRRPTTFGQAREALAYVLGDVQRVLVTEIFSDDFLCFPAAFEPDKQ